MNEVNIMFLWHSPFKDAGGVGNVTSALAWELVEMGHHVLYMAMSNGQNYTDDIGIVQLFATKHKKASKQTRVNKVISIIREKKIELVINQSGIFDNRVTKAISAMKNRPLIFSVHHNCIKCYQDVYTKIIRESHNSIFRISSKFKITRIFLKQLNKFRYGMKFKRCLRYSDRLILLSNLFVAELSVYLKSIPFEKISVIPNPIERAFYEKKILFAEKENRILFVGRLNDSQKQASLLIGIWKALYNDFPEWSLDVVGDGPIYNKLVAQSKEFQLKRIQFYGHQNPLPFYQKSKVFLMPSLFEGFPLVLVEAQAQGVVPIAFNCFSSIDDIIVNGETGFFVPLNDLSKFINVLRSVLSSDQELLSRQSNVAQDHAQQFHPRQVAKLWMALMDDSNR